MERHHITMSESRLEIVWALVLLQGAILVLTTLESLVANVGFGFLLIGNLALTAGAAVATLLAAKGLRRRRRWARRLTFFGEGYLLAIGGIDLALTLFLAGTLPGVVPIVVTIAVPVTVIVMLRSLRSEFPRHRPDPVAPAERLPSEDPVLGTAVS